MMKKLKKLINNLKKLIFRLTKLIFGAIFNTGGTA